MKRTIFFDLGNVLIFFDHQKMCRQVATYCSLDETQVGNLMQKYMDPYERGQISNRELYDELCQITQKKLHFETLMHSLSDIFQPNEAVIAIVKKLKAKGHSLFILSNTCDAHFTYAASRYPFLHQFDGYILSYEVKARKPEKEIYEKALEIAGCQKSDCFYTDDVLSYIETARSLQMDAEQYTNPHDLNHHLHARGML